VVFANIARLITRQCVLNEHLGWISVQHGKHLVGASKTSLTLGSEPSGVAFDRVRNDDNWIARPRIANAVSDKPQA
jgi:hypothetical protein